jgi:pimeloyl-ACP methyl ester carboxylesterase
MNAQAIEVLRQRRMVATRHGKVSVVDVGEGPALLFVHGVFSGAFLWSQAMAALRTERRCIALDLPAHGESPMSYDQDLSLSALADILEDLCRELELEQVDLVGNDTGGAICQIFAAGHHERIRTLTLTNCDAHDNLPPEAFRNGKELAERGELAGVFVHLATHRAEANGIPGLGMTFERPERLDDEEFHLWLGHYANLAQAEAGQHFTTFAKAEDLLAAEENLKALGAPTLIIWGTGDIFFEVDWAYWLRDNIAGAQDVVEIPGAKLFFPYERAQEFVGPLHEFLDRHSPTRMAATAL